MKYSFVIIAYNEENNIALCIKSILQQKDLGGDYEIIMVDDGSHDKTPDIIKWFMNGNKNIKLVRDGKNHGRGYGRYVGARKAKGSYVAMVDADTILPKSWLSTCIKHINKYDVVGGIAVPDGDVAYVYRRFHLKPKAVMGSVGVTGCNGLYKHRVFKKVTFDKNLRDGEDVDFNHRATDAGVSTFCIPGLSVDHQEHKSFGRSIMWLYQSGVGATRQLIRFKEVRLPDIAFIVTLTAAIIGIMILALTGSGLGLILPIVCLIGASFLHLRGKFDMRFSKAGALLGALIVNTVLILCYYVGRLIGPIAYLLKLNQSGAKQ